MTMQKDNPDVDLPRVVQFIEWGNKRLVLSSHTFTVGFKAMHPDLIYDLTNLPEQEQVDFLLQNTKGKFLVNEGVEISPDRNCNVIQHDIDIMDIDGTYYTENSLTTQTNTPEEFAEDILSQAITIFQQRGTQYGTVEDNNLKHIKYANTLREILGPLGANEMAIQMCGNKLARLQTICDQGIKPYTKITPMTFDDTVLDFVNYFLFACGAKRKIMFNENNKEDVFKQLHSQTQTDREKDALNASAKSEQD